MCLVFLGGCQKSDVRENVRRLLAAKTSQEEIAVFAAIQSAPTSYTVRIARSETGSIELLEIKWDDGTSVSWKIIDQQNIRILVRDK
jgi:hypothetical protein